MEVPVDAWARLPLNELTLDQVTLLKNLLTVWPKKIGDHPGDDPGPIYLFEQHSDHLAVPRQFYKQHKKPHHHTISAMSSGGVWPEQLTLLKVPRLEQAQALDFTMDQFLQKDSWGFILQAVPGWGKTIFACMVMQALKVPVLVVVHKEFLMNQWVKRLKETLGGIRVGIAQQDVCDWKDKHVVVGMVHSLAGRSGYSAEFRKWPGLVIFDETHRVGAETWSPVPALFPARWRLGLSATPKRKDGADAVLTQHIGPILFRAKEQMLSPAIKRVWTSWKPVATPKFNPETSKKPRLLRFMCLSAARNSEILLQILKALEAGRKLLVLSERRAHLELLSAGLTNAFSGRPAPTMGFYVGGMAENELDRSAKCQVLFATYQMCSEGLDIPDLDTQVLATPVSDMEQVAGRILRTFPGLVKKPPIIVDFRDDTVGRFRRMGQGREKFYVRKGWMRAEEATR